VKRAAIVLELALRLALVVLLGVAAYKLLRVLSRLDVRPAWSVLFLLVFVGAAIVAGWPIPRGVRQLRRGEDGGVSRRER